MNSPVQLSTATAADISELEALVNRAYRGAAGQVGWTAESHLLAGPRTDAAALAELLRTPEARILLARDAAQQLLGCVYLQLRADEVYVGLLAVAPERQASGLGKHLLAAAEAYGAQHRCRTATMTVLADRPELVAWYERHGYRRSGETRPFPNDPQHGIPKQALTLLVLTKPLAAAPQP
ncbi:GNAT family N-acetyltransferase [Hymenobacter sp. CRA2]|uniref:GNAT family N-acetyltransferase n=1 Tax=Hymenobacter sp. CRA2 TaxID=1955620 RepID=UPI0009901B12|nr:GNAT family N-acetyltransferase [Hymenobacter sp. CRA2]OON66220.1 hypothetical protein B0919_22285 [Hymenobacter sp. CRA2]